MMMCQHPSPDEECLESLICGRPAVDKLVWSDGSATYLCAIHIDYWINDLRLTAQWSMLESCRDEAVDDLRRNHL